ncbi:Nse4 C-terminal-domain-containing protein [Dichotomocladium elegans]|nr:Nse4 C-terminal-domain-containing protein [Dichotomocladium elegans]
MATSHNHISRNDSQESHNEAISEYELLTQQLATKVDSSMYDPRQDKEERRGLRKRYRTLIQDTEERRRDIVFAEPDALYRAVIDGNGLFEEVRNPLEATLDARFFSITATIAMQKARNTKLGLDIYNVDEFISKVKTFGSEDRSSNDGNLDWTKIGFRAFQHSQRVKSTDFLLGPLAVEKKHRKAGPRARIIKNKEDLVQPTQLHKDDLQQQENETSGNVNTIYKILHERGPCNYLEFITNPDSFSQTVENMFYVSFLIRNAVAEIDDSSGHPMLYTRTPPTQDELAGNVTKSQLIMNIDVELWKEIIETYNIRSSAIPTRPKVKAIATSKWY